MFDKQLFIIRGIPGSGKSTLAKNLNGKHIEADMYFMLDGEYKFDVSKIHLAHQWCKKNVEDWMVNGDDRIIVSNTFTQEWEMEPYFELSKKYGYTVFSLIMENRHGNENIHKVPKEKIEQMRNRFEIKL